MGTKIIPLSRLETDLLATLNECADTGQAFVIELPGERHVAIYSLEPNEDDHLTSDLLESNPAFQELVAKAKAGPSEPYIPGSLD
jgi:hypothetical protein